MLELTRVGLRLGPHKLGGLSYRSNVLSVTMCCGSFSRVKLDDAVVANCALICARSGECESGRFSVRFSPAGD